MKKTTIAELFALLVMATGAASLHAMALPALPAGNLPDTEIATNVALNVQYDSTIVFGLAIDTACCVSNEVLVAVGCDSDGNGDLSLDEAAFVYGIESGVRYLVDFESGTATTDVPAVLSIRARHFNPAWNMMKVVKRGEGDVGESVATNVERKFFSISIR